MDRRSQMAKLREGRDKREAQDLLEISLKNRNFDILYLYLYAQMYIKEH